MKKFKIGLIGAGTVGKGLLQMLKDQKSVIRNKYGLELELAEVATRTPSKIAGLTDCPTGDQWESVTKNPDIDLVVELIGGTTTAFEIARSALENGKTLITANKALVSEKGRELFSLAESKNLEIGYEAAVAGAIPVIRTLRNGLGPNDFQYIAGILNGTTNFILTKMEKENLSYLEALKLAQDAGYAEADPTFDVEGIDVAHKISILGNLAFGRYISVSHIETKGITKISDLDIQNALRLGFRIKLLGLTRKIDDRVLARVQPVLIPLSHPLANIMNENNAVYYRTNYSGSGMLSGKGAGANPTASAVLADIVFYASRRGSILANNDFLEKNRFQEANYDSSEDEISRYYLRFTTVDKPGVLAEISKILGKNAISISSVQQNESIENEPTNVVILTHSAKQKNYNDSIQEIDRLSDIIREPTVAFPLLENL